MPRDLVQSSVLEMSSPRGSLETRVSFALALTMAQPVEDPLAEPEPVAEPESDQ